MSVELRLDKVDGFHQETLHDVRLRYRGTGSTIETLILSATTSGDQAVHFRHRDRGRCPQRHHAVKRRRCPGALSSDIYDRMEGGRLELAISGPTDGPLSGHRRCARFLGRRRTPSRLDGNVRAGGRKPVAQPGAAQPDRRFAGAFRSRLRGRSARGQATLSVERGCCAAPTSGTTFRGML